MQLIDAHDDGRVVMAVGTHMNPEGMFVVIADPPELGARVRVTLNAEGTDGVLSAEGTVVDRVVVDAGSDRRPGVGVRFDQIGAAWTKLYEWLAM